MIRITIACPEALVDDANQLAALMAESPDAASMFGIPSWQRGADRYALASLEVEERWLEDIMATPDTHGPGGDIPAAERAQAALHIWRSGSAEAPPTAAADLIAAIAGPPPQVALAMLDVAPVPEEF